jgi:hypothetical protein
MTICRVDYRSFSSTIIKGSSRQALLLSTCVDNNLAKAANDLTLLKEFGTYSLQSNAIGKMAETA